VQNVTCNWYGKGKHTPIQLLISFIHIVTLKVSEAIWLLHKCLNFKIKLFAQFSCVINKGHSMFEY
jgi:hypothetical protein